MGARLFDRDNRSVRLTNAGETLREATQGMIEGIDAAVNAARLASAEEEGALDIGFSGLALLTPMGEILRRFQQRQPSVTIRMHHLWGGALERGLTDGAFHAAFLSTPLEDRRLDSIQIGHEEIFLCVPENHKIAQRAAVTFADLKGEPLILFPEDEGPNIYHTFMAGCRQAGFTPNVVAHATKFPKVTALAAIGQGLGFVSKSLVGDMPTGLVMRPFAEPGFAVTIGLAWNQLKIRPLVLELIAIAKALTSEQQKT